MIEKYNSNEAWVHGDFSAVTIFDSLEQLAVQQWHKKIVLAGVRSWASKMKQLAALALKRGLR